MAPPNLEQLANRLLSMADNLSREAFPVGPSSSPPPAQPKWRTLLAGAFAGLVVDTSLYPVDTIKSRLQSKQGFSKAGGFSHLYRGLPPVLAGSLPNGKYKLVNSPTTQSYHLDHLE